MNIFLKIWELSFAGLEDAQLFLQSGVLTWSMIDLSKVIENAGESQIQVEAHLSN